MLVGYPTHYRGPFLTQNERGTGLGPHLEPSLTPCIWMLFDLDLNRIEGQSLYSQAVYTFIRQTLFNILIKIQNKTKLQFN